MAFLSQRESFSWQWKFTSQIRPLPWFFLRNWSLSFLPFCRGEEKWLLLVVCAQTFYGLLLARQIASGLQISNWYNPFSWHKLIQSYFSSCIEDIFSQQESKIPITDCEARFPNCFSQLFFFVLSVLSGLCSSSSSRRHFQKCPHKYSWTVHFHCPSVMGEIFGEKGFVSLLCSHMK